MKKYDLIVTGGGLTGVAAAVSAAREGLSVLLVEQSGALGGALNTNLVYPFMRYWTDCPDGTRKWLSAGIFTEIFDKTEELCKPMSKIDFSPEHMKVVLDRLCVEAGVDLLFHASMFEAVTEARKVKSIKVATKAGAMELEADFFVDATGDGDLLAFAGCDFQLGREADGLCQPMTTCFRLANMHPELLGPEGKKAIRPMLNELYQKYKAAGKINNPREDILWFKGTALGETIAHFNTTRIVKMDPTNPLDVSKAEVEARRQVLELLELLREIPVFKDATLVSIATSIGVRESRKLKGEHIITAEELKNCTKFEDSIALGNYDIDIHNPEGAGTSHYYFAPGDYYTIPYRSLLPVEFDNLLTGGRCISATHEAQASIRIMPICATTGQAAGTAVAVAKKTGTNTHTVDIKEVQKVLRQNGAAID